MESDESYKLPINIPKYKRFIYKNENNLEFSQNITEKEFFKILDKYNGFITFNENGLSDECDKCHCYESIFLKMNIPDLKSIKGKIEIQSSKNRMKEYLEIHIQKEIQKEIDKLKPEIEKKIKEKYIST